MTYHVAPDQYVPKNSPATIVVREKSGVVYFLNHPTIEGETLRGVDVHTSEPVALPLSSVQEAIVTRKSPARTVLLIGTLTGAVAAAALRGRGGKGDSCKLISDHEDVVGYGTLCEPIS